MRGLDDPAQMADAIAWWETLTAQCGEGMVVKPLAFVADRTEDLERLKKRD